MDDSLVGRCVYGLARLTALAGGAVLVVVMLVTVVSIAGRMMIPLGLGAILGDFEIVQAGMLFAIFAFLPWAHLVRGHALVAILTDRFPVRLNALLELLWDIVMLAVAAFIAWRLHAGLLDKQAFGESTFILRVPLWYIYAAGLAGAVVFVVVAAYCAARSAGNAFGAEPVRPAGGGGGE